MPAFEDEIVQEARRWVGTPFHHRASACGSGADCLGLLRGLWRRFYGAEPAPMPPYTRDWSEAAGQEHLWQGLAAHMVEKPASSARRGDVILMRMRDKGVAKHLGVQSSLGSQPQFIHAFWGHGVVESALSTPWARRVVARFEFPDRRV